MSKLFATLFIIFERPT